MVERMKWTAGHLDEDHACMSCGYNLRGLNECAFCPECGKPVSESLQGNLLRFTSPEWFGKICLGVTAKLWHILLSIFAAVGSMIFTEIGFMEPIYALQLFTALVWVWGTYLITTPEPATEAVEDTYALRKILRVCVWLSFAGSVATALNSLNNPQLAQGMATGMQPTVLGIVGAAAGLFGVVVLFGELLYFRRFVRRIPNAKLDRFTTIILYGYPISFFLTVFFALLMVLGLVITQPASLSPGMVVVMGCTCVGGIGILVFGLAYVVLLFKLKSAFSGILQSMK